MGIEPMRNPQPVPPQIAELADVSAPDSRLLQNPTSQGGTWTGLWLCGKTALILGRCRAWLSVLLQFR